MKVEQFGNQSLAARERAQALEAAKTKVTHGEPIRMVQPEVVSAEQVAIESVILETDQQKRITMASALKNILNQINFPPVSLPKEVSDDERKRQLGSMVGEYLAAVQAHDEKGKKAAIGRIQYWLG